MTLKKSYSQIRLEQEPDWQGDFTNANEGFFLFFDRPPTKRGDVSGVYIDGRGEGSFRGRINRDVFRFSMAYSLSSPWENKSLPGEPIRFYSESRGQGIYQGEFTEEVLSKGIKEFTLQPYKKS